MWCSTTHCGSQQLSVAVVIWAGQHTELARQASATEHGSRACMSRMQLDRGCSQVFGYKLRHLCNGVGCCCSCLLATTGSWDAMQNAGAAFGPSTPCVLEFMNHPKQHGCAMGHACHLPGARFCVYRILSIVWEEQCNIPHRLVMLPPVQPCMPVPMCWPCAPLRPTPCRGAGAARYIATDLRFCNRQSRHRTGDCHRI